VSSFSGKKVLIVGGLVPSANAAATAGAGTTGSAGSTSAGSMGASSSLAEFRVVSVKPAEGPCPPK
jgi:hypothetical protein